MVWTLTKAAAKHIIVSHGLQGCNFIVAENTKDDLGKAVVYSSKTFSDNAEFESCLNEIIQQHSLQKAICNVVMRAGTYSHLLIDKPIVPVKEMAEAIEWLTKDLVKSLPYETPLLSHFYGSELLKGKEQNKLHVVVAEQNTVAHYQQLIFRQGLKLGAMTIEELAIVNMLHKASADCAIVYLALCPGKSNSAVFVLNNKLLGIKRLPSVALDSASDFSRQQADFSQLWQGLQQNIEHYLQSVKKDCSYKVMLSPCSYSSHAGNSYLGCEAILQQTFTDVFDTNIEMFDVENDFYSGPMAKELCQKNNILLLGAC